MRTRNELRELERRIAHALEQANAIDEKVVTYLLTMAKLGVAQEIEKLPTPSSPSMLPSVPLVPWPAEARSA